MAEGSNSPAFNPPMNRVTDDQPDIIRVAMRRTEIGFRDSQQSGLMTNNSMTVKTLKNG